MAKPDAAWRRVYELDHLERFETSDAHMLATCCAEMKRKIEELEAQLREQNKKLQALANSSAEVSA
jgi:hypothetical protein